MRRAAKTAGIPVQLNRCGSMFCCYFTSEPVHNLADAMKSDRARFGKYFHGMLAEGIYLALETTVAGLLIAIPASLFASYFHSRSERFVREIGDCLNHALPVLAALAPGKPSPAAAPTSARSNPLMVDR